MIIDFLPPQCYYRKCTYVKYSGLATCSCYRSKSGHHERVFPFQARQPVVLHFITIRFSNLVRRTAKGGVRARARVTKRLPICSFDGMGLALKGIVTRDRDGANNRVTHCGIDIMFSCDSFIVLAVTYFRVLGILSMILQNVCCTLFEQRAPI